MDGDYASDIIKISLDSYSEEKFKQELKKALDFDFTVWTLNYFKELKYHKFTE